MEIERNGGVGVADEKNIDTLYSKVNKLSDRMTKIESTRPFLEDLIKRNIKTNEELSKTLNGVQMSMVRMNEKMDEQSEALVSMKQEFEEANKKTNEKIENVKKYTAEKIQAVDSRVDEVEEKGKFDFLLWIKSNWPWIVCVLGLGILYASSYVKF